MSQRLLVYTDDSDRGGVAQYNHCIAMGLVARGYAVTVVQSESRRWMATAQAAAGVAHRWISYDTGKEFMRTITDTGDAERALAEAKPELVIFSDCCPVSNTAAKHVAVKLGLPYIIVENFVGAYLAERFKNCLPILAKQYQFAKAVVAVSTENLGLLHQHFRLPADKGTIIYYGASEKFFAARNESARKEIRDHLGIADDSVVCITPARLDPIKGHVYQLYALNLLQKQNRTGRLVCLWVGEGDLRSTLATEIAKLSLGRNVILAGHQPDMERWYDAADLFALTSTAEGMPITIMEGMAKGLPVIGTAVSGIPEEIGTDGILLPSPLKDPGGVVVQLAEAWEKLVKAPAMRSALSQQSRLRAARLFREEIMVGKTIDLVQGVLAGTR
jgi:glycosyltransferase involved in cell wall biosynthesis